MKANRCRQQTSEVSEHVFGTIIPRLATAITDTHHVLHCVLLFNRQT